MIYLLDLLTVDRNPAATAGVVRDNLKENPMSKNNKQDIIDLEKRFWDTMKTKDADTATAMMAEESVVIGPQGASKIVRGDFARMMEGSKWTLESYNLSKVEVLFPSEDVAVIGYTVQQNGKMDGKPYDMQAADSTTWVRQGDEWLCVLHTETPLEQKKAA